MEILIENKKSAGMPRIAAPQLKRVEPRVAAHRSKAVDFTQAPAALCPVKFCHFSYLANPGVAPLRPHELRDADAFVEVSHALTKLGHEYCGLIINYPKEPPKQDFSESRIRSLSAQDFIVLTTRPPLNDSSQTGNVKVVRRSHTELEHLIFDSIRRYFATCSRDEIQLDDPTCLRDEFKNRADLRYYVKTNRGHPRFESAYHARENEKQFASFDPNVTTAGYLLHTAPIALRSGKRGPRVLACFGVSGTIGLILAYLLRTQPFDPFVGLFDRILAKPALAMVEITVPEPDPIPRPFEDLSFSTKWKYQLLTK
jgi:hypothetical protein